MAKLKQRRRHFAQGNKNNRQAASDEGDWVMVKKQRVTILIPPLPREVQPTNPCRGEAQLQENSRKANVQSPEKNKAELQYPPSKHSVDEAKKSIFSFAEGAVQPSIVVPPSDPTLSSQKLLIASHRVAPDSSPLHSVKDGRCISIFNPPKARGMMIFADRSAFHNRRIRASCLEKNIEKVGGLENWLVSLGLSCFLNVFQGKYVSKFLLANLTMKKLKDMGAFAVGPRRKLIHAIDCICEPRCFQNL